MKKSTLITTIAMIVVVVVALSTATYAWFTSSDTAVATTSFSTTATGDWSMVIGSVSDITNTGTAKLTFNTAAVDSATLTGTAIQSGLWAPTAAIATTISDTKASTSLAAMAGFVSGTRIDNDTAKVEALLTKKFKSNQTTPAPGVGLVAPFAMRIINTSGADKTLELNITLNAGQQTTNNSLYGAAAVRFYVYEISNAGSNNTKTYTSGYNYSVKGANFGADDLDTITGIQTSSGTESVDRTMTADDVDMTQVSSADLFDNLADYTVADISSLFDKADAPDDNLGIAENDYVLTYTFPMQTYANGGFSNIIIYAWIDGWVADNSAGRATFSVNFGFKSVSNP